jgi:hypothetical protein
MAAARVQILLHFFAVKTQQIGANIVDVVDIVAVFSKRLISRARIFPSGVWKLSAPPSVGQS